MRHTVINNVDSLLDSVESNNKLTYLTVAPSVELI